MCFVTASPNFASIFIHALIKLYANVHDTYARLADSDSRSWRQGRIIQCPTRMLDKSIQSISQQSKTHTSIADPGSTSGGTFQCMQFLPFFIYFSYLFYLGHLSLLGLQTKTRRQSNSSTFSSFKSHNPETFMSSAAITFVHAVCKRSQVPRAKSGTFWFSWMDSHDSRTIQ